jgi:hypothetical protein
MCVATSRDIHKAGSHQPNGLFLGASILVTAMTAPALLEHM